MQATYCDLCGKKIRTVSVRKEMPVLFTSCIHWTESDICPECEQNLAEYCKKLKEGEDDSGK